MKQIADLRKMSNEELLRVKKETELLWMGCHKGVKPLVIHEKEKNLQKEIARINTLLRERWLKHD